MQRAAINLVGNAVTESGLDQAAFDHHMFLCRDSPAVAAAMSELGGTGMPGSGPEAEMSFGTLMTVRPWLQLLLLLGTS